MKSDFDFIVNPKKIVKLSIMCLGFYFNRATLEIMGYPDRVNIGIDYKHKQLCIRKAVDDENIKQYLLWQSKDKRFGKIHCGGVVEQIGDIINTTFGIRVKYYQAYYDKKKECLIVDLSKEMK